MKVIGDENHVGGLLAHIGTVLAHCNANVSTLQGDAIVDAVTRHADNVAATLQRLQPHIDYNY